MHKAIITLAGCSPFHFASLDGETFIEVTREPEAGDEADVAKLIEGENGTRPMRIAKRWLRQHNAVFTEVTP